MQNKGQLITLWVNDKLKEKIQDKAKSEDRTISSWIRRLLELALKEKDGR